MIPKRTKVALTNNTKSSIRFEFPSGTAIIFIPRPAHVRPAKRTEQMNILITRKYNDEKSEAKPII